MISKVNRVRRRAWCRSNLHKTVETYWKNVIFSDDLKVYVWRKDSEKWAPRCLGEFKDQNPRLKASVMFWGCISFDGVGTLVPVNGN